MAEPAILGGAPVCDVSAWPQWPQWNDCEAKALQAVLESGQWQAGTQVAAFEEAFAAYQSAAAAVCVTNGTATLEIALRALGVESGDEVIVPTYTFAATALAVMMVGAKPVFVDSDPDSLNLEPGAAHSALSERTRAVIPVHVGGQPVDVDRILELAHTHELAVIEDAAHAHGAEWRGVRVGALGDCGSFSFQTGKSLTSGDGGCLTTRDPQLAGLFRSIRAFGRSAGGTIERLGSNYRMTEFQAAILRCGLERLDAQIEQRQRNAARLHDALRGLPGVWISAPDPRVTRHPYYQILLHYDPDIFGLPKALLLKALNAEGVPLEGGYEPLHRLPFFKEALARGNARALPCPVAEEAADATVLWLSFRLALAQEEQVDAVALAFERLYKYREQLAKERTV